MPLTEKDEAREYRISMEAIVVAYGPEEQAMGWYYYLDDLLHFPFHAKCIQERRISPLKIGEKVEVVGMAQEDDCMHEMFVEIRWMDRTLSVPLVQLETLDKDEERQEAMGDWRYWIERGYQLC